MNHRLTYVTIALIAMLSVGGLVAAQSQNGSTPDAGIDNASIVQDGSPTANSTISGSSNETASNGSFNGTDGSRKQNGTVRNGTVRNGTVRNGTVRNGTVRNGTVRNGTVRNGTVRNGTVRNGSDVDDGTATSVARGEGETDAERDRVQGGSDLPGGAKISTALKREMAGEVGLGASQQAVSGPPATVDVMIRADEQRGRSVADAARGLGSDVIRAGDLVEAELPTSAVTTLAQDSDVAFVQKPIVAQQAVTSEGVDVINATEAQARGFSGQGVDVGVIDFNFTTTNPEIASNVNSTLNLTGQSLSPDHGTASAEIVVDVAPNVSLNLVQARTAVQLINAIQHLEQNTSTDVISMSLSFPGGLRLDGRDPVSDQIDETVGINGSLAHFNSAGNYAGGDHWNGTWQDTNGNDKNEFTGTREKLFVNYSAGNPEVGLRIQWSDWDFSSEDYNVAFVNTTTDTVIEWSNNTQDGTGAPLETFSGSTPVTPPYSAYLQIVDNGSSGNADFDVFSGGDGTLNPTTDTRSVTPPATARNASAIGAADYSTLTMESFSSRGPTIDGRRKPDLTGPDCVSTSTPGFGTYCGTSASAPHAAGAAALMEEWKPGLTPQQIYDYLEGNTTPLTAGEPNTVSGFGLVDVNDSIATQTAGGGLNDISSCREINASNAPSDGLVNLTADITTGVTNCIEITTSDVTLDGRNHTLSSGVNPSTGIDVQGSGGVANVTVRNVTVNSGFTEAIDFAGATESLAEDVTSENNFNGVRFNQANNSTVRNSLLRGNTQGVRLTSAPDIRVRSNTLDVNDIGVDVEDSPDATVAATDIYASNDQGILVTSSNGTVVEDGTYINDSTLDGVRLVGANDTTIRDTTIASVMGRGVNLTALGGSTNTTLDNVSATDGSSEGVVLDGGTDVSLRDVNASANSRGLELLGTRNVTVRNGSYDANTGDGVFANVLATDTTLRNITANDNTINGRGLSLGNDTTMIDVTAARNAGVALRAFADPDGPIVATNLTIGASTAPATAIDGEFVEIELAANTSPPSDPAGEQNIGRYVNLTEDTGTPSPLVSYANLTFRYTDADVSGVDESQLDVWKFNATSDWTEFGAGPATDAAANEIQYNVTAVGSQVAPLAAQTAGGGGLNDVSSCRTINASNAPADGLVNLTSDITNAAPSSCVNVTVSDVTLAGGNHTVDGTPSGVNANGTGVLVTNASTPITNVTVRNVTVTDWGQGVRYDDVSGGAVRDLLARFNTQHVHTTNSVDNLTVADNVANDTVSSNSGLDVGGTDQLITGNLLGNSRRSIRVSATSSIVEQNTVVDEQLFAIEVTGSDTVVRNNTLRPSSLGIRVRDFNNITVRDNEIDGSVYGATTGGIDVTGTLSFTGDNHIINNTVDQVGGYGIRVEGAQANTTIRDNTVTDAGQNGTVVLGVNGTVIEGGRIDGSGNHGILLRGTNHTVVRDTELNGSSSRGVMVVEGAVTSTNVTVRNATSTNNSVGVDVQAGIADAALRRSDVSSNDYGHVLRSAGARAINNNLTANQFEGLRVVGVTGGVFRENNVSGNNLSATSHPGIEVLSGAQDNYFENTTLLANAFSVDSAGPVPTTNTTLEALDIGASTAADTTLDVAARNLSLDAATSPPADPANEQNIGRFVDATSFGPDAYLNVTFRYTDADASGVDESRLDVWKHNGSWTELGAGPATDAAANEVQYNVSDVGSVFAPLANTSSVTGTPDPTPGPLEVSLTDGAGTANATWAVNTETETVNLTDGAVTDEAVASLPDFPNGTTKAIAFAVDNATATNDTVVVGDGSFNASLTIDDNDVALVDASDNATRLDAWGGDHGIEIATGIDDVTVRGFDDVTNATGAGGVGVNLGSSNDNVTLEDLNVSDTASTGISGNSFVSNLTISGGSVERAATGVALISSEEDVVIEDLMVNDPGNRGISLDVVDATIRRNVLTNTSGVGMIAQGTNVTARDNELRNITDTGIRVRFSTDVDLIGNDVDGTDPAGFRPNGIDVRSGVGVTVRDNVVNGSGEDGIRVGANDVTLANNTATNASGHGVHVTPDIAGGDGDNATLTGTTVRASTDDGIHVDTANETTIEGGALVNGSGRYGIRLDDANDTVIRDSTVNDSDDVGISAVQTAASSTNVTVRNVTLASNGDGVGMSVRDATVAAVTAIGNGAHGIQLFGTDGTVRNSSATGHGLSGIRVTGNGSTVVDSNASLNAGDGVRVSGDSDGAFDNRFRNVTARDNGDRDFDIRDVLATPRNTTVEALDVGASTASGTTIDFAARNVALNGTDAAPSDPAGEQNIGRFVNATNTSADHYLNLTFRYTDGDVASVDESRLDVWKHNGSWTELGAGPATDAGANEVQYNVSDVGSVFAPLANTSAVSGGLNNINSCRTINASNRPSDGLVNLTADILDAPQQSCINVTVSDVTLDGQGHEVNGTLATPSSGVLVNNDTTSLSNVTLRDIKVTGWNNGVNLTDVSQSNATAVNATRNDGPQIFTDATSDNITIRASTVLDDQGTTAGVLVDSADSVVRNTTFQGNHDQLTVDSDRTVVENNVFAQPSGGTAQILVSNGGNVTVRNNKVNDTTGVSIRGIETDSFATDPHLINNTLAGTSGTSIFVSSIRSRVNENNITDSGTSAIILGFNADDSSAENNTVVDPFFGISHAGVGQLSANNTVTGSSRVGVEVEGADAIVRDTNVSNNMRAGVKVQDPAGASVNNVTVSNVTALANAHAVNISETLDLDVTDLNVGASTASNTTFDLRTANNVTLAAEQTPPADPAGQQNISRFVAVDNTTSQSFAFVNVSYEAGDVSGSESDLAMWKYNASTGWINTTNVAGQDGVDTAANEVFTNTSQFSVLAPMEPAATGGGGGLNAISSCRTINASNAPADGLVNLTSDINDATPSNCINITVSDITFRGQGNLVDGDGTGEVGINVTNGSFVGPSISNVTVRNVTVTDWTGDSGIKYDDADDGALEDVNATANDDGFRLVRSDRLDVNGSLALRNTGSGFSIAAGGTNVNLTDVNATSNLRGILAQSGSVLEVRRATTLDNNEGMLINSDSLIVNSTSTQNVVDFQAGGDAPTAQNLDIGSSTAPDTTLDVTAKDVELSRNTSPPTDPMTEQNISRFLDATNTSADHFLNVTFEYNDSDVASVDESRLDVWKHNGSWTELGTGPATDAAANEVQYNVSDVGSVFAPLANTSTGSPTFDVAITGTNSPVTEGDTLDVTATITNTGGASGSQTVDLDVGGSTRDSQSVSLAAGNSQTVTLSWATSNGDAGNYTPTVSSANDSESTSVTVLAPNVPSGSGPVVGFGGGGGGGDDTSGGFRNKKPNAVFDADPRPPEPGEEVSFDAGRSSDPEGEIRSYRWVIDGERYRGQLVRLSFDEVNSSHDVQLRVVDDLGASDRVRDTVTVVADRPSPTPSTNGTTDTQTDRSDETDADEDEDGEDTVRSSQSVEQPDEETGANESGEGQGMPMGLLSVVIALLIVVGSVAYRRM